MTIFGQFELSEHEAREKPGNAELSSALWSREETGTKTIERASFSDHPKEGYYIDNGLRSDYNKSTGIPWRVENGNGTCWFTYPGGGGEYVAPCGRKKHRK